MQALALLGFAGAALAACNGHDELCDRKYSDITFVGSHDSAFVGFLPVDNQFISVTDQLDYGVRYLQAQTHDKDGTIELCHTFCWEEDAGPLSDYFKEVADWMSDNPDEVITMLLTNGDAISVKDFDKAFADAGLKDYTFSPDGVLAKEDWPTLQELLDDGTRLIVFMDANNDQDEVPYIISEFDYYWETAYDVTDENFPSCDIDRPDGADPAKLMGIMNHMLHYEVAGIVFPDMDSIGDTNAKDSIQSQVDVCKDKHDVQPNVILLDFVNVGDAMDAFSSLNGL